MLIITLILAGIWAQKWGKKRFVTSGQYILAVGLLTVSFAQTYPMLIIGLMITGIGGGFIEALINPLVVDIHPGESGKYLNITNAFYPIGIMTSALLFGELLTLGYSWRELFRIAALGALVMGIFFNVSRFPSPIDHSHSALNTMGRILVSSRFWLFAVAIFLGAGAESSFTFWSRTYVEIYLWDLPRAGAIAVVIFAGMMAIGRFLVARLSRKMSLKMIMMCSAILGVGVSGVIPFITDLAWFYVLLGIAGIAAACFWPTILAEATDCIEVDPTILFVLLACVGVAGFGLIPWIMGIIGDSVGLRTGFAVIPGLFVGLIIVLSIEWRVSHTKEVCDG